MKHCFLLVLLFAGVKNLSAQLVIENNMLYKSSGGSLVPLVGGAAVNNSKYGNITEGSPFFKEDWIQSTVVAQDGTLFKNVSVKLNLLENSVHYLDGAGAEFVATAPLREIQLQHITGKSFHFINGNLLPNPKKGWHILLVNDTVSLIKTFTKAIVEQKNYGAPSELKIQTNEKYFLLFNKMEYEIKKPSDLINILPAKRAQIEAQIKQTNKLSREEQIIAVAKYCASLLKS